MNTKETVTKKIWKRELLPAQTVWKRISTIFIIFYVLEAVLFWHGLCLAKPILEIPYAVPWIYPLGFWGLFACIIYWQIKSRPTLGTSRLMDRVLATGIPLGVIGITFLVMKYSGNTTLGHITMFGSLYLAAVSIGGATYNIGWLSASGVWLASALGILLFPHDLRLIRPFREEDLIVGLGLALGFAAIGHFPYAMKCETRQMGAD